MQVTLPTAKITDHGNVKLGTGDAQDMKTVRVTLPTSKIADHGNVKLGTSDAQDMRSGK